MPSQDEIARAVDLQTRSHALLTWVGSAVEQGFISFDAAHAYASATDSAEAWIRRHYQDIPERARPAMADLGDFCGLFCAYLENSFELLRKPGKRLYSPQAHCFCPMCSWLVDVPHLKTRTPSAADKKRALKMMREVPKRLAIAHGLALDDAAAAAIAADPALRESLALWAYAGDLMQRMKGVAIGPAALVLWRQFAWLPAGSPKKDFTLSAELFMEAEQRLLERMRPPGEPG